MKRGDPSGAAAYMDRIHGHVVAKDFPEWPPFHILTRVVKAWRHSKRPESKAILEKLEPYYEKREEQDKQKCREGSNK